MNLVFPNMLSGANDVKINNFSNLYLTDRKRLTEILSLKPLSNLPNYFTSHLAFNSVYGLNSNSLFWTYQNVQYGESGRVCAIATAPQGVPINENIFEPNIENISTVSKKINSITKEIYKQNDGFDSSHIKYISISTSNYSSVYIIADKLTNMISIAFRGTYSIKSALSYLKLTSIKPYQTNKKSNNGILLGVFKIVGEIFYTINESIHFLSKNFLRTDNYKLVTTGHSLGGGCAQIFSYLLIKNKPNLKITCVTFGGPRTMNKSLITKYNNYIENKVIMFRRYITNGDPIPLLPFTTNSGNNSYYHTDDNNDKINNNNSSLD